MKIMQHMTLHLSGILFWVHAHDRYSQMILLVFKHLRYLLRFHLILRRRRRRYLLLLIRLCFLCPRHHRLPLHFIILLLLTLPVYLHSLSRTSSPSSSRWHSNSWTL